MSLIVKVFVNRTEILDVHARRIEDFKGPEEVHTYQTGKEHLLKHKYSDGAAKLAIKILEVDGYESKLSN